jgi:hypothetical protein
MAESRQLHRWLTVGATNLRNRDSHSQARAHAGRTKKPAAARPASPDNPRGS